MPSLVVPARAEWTRRLRTFWTRFRRYVVIAGAIVAVVLAQSSLYGSQLLALVVIYALAVAGWNVISGYAGQPSLGHAAFFGLGAYGAAVWAVQLERSPWVGIALGAVASAVLGMLVGWVSWRLRIHGIYFALILFAVSELLLVLVENVEFLGGTIGLFGILGEDSFVMLSFTDPRWFALLAGVALGIVLLGTAALSRSRFGRQMAVVRSDEVAAEASGIDTMRVKVIALGISAVITAVAGGFYAQLQLFVQPETVFGMQTNLRFILIGFIGGAGALWGPVIGSTVVTAVETAALELFSGQPGVDGIAFGLLLVAAVSFLPRGLAWRNSPATTPLAPLLRRFHPRRRSEVPRSPSAASPGNATSPGPVPAEQRTADQRTDADHPPSAVPRHHDGDTVLDAVDLSKHFGGLTVVDGVSLQLCSGTIHGLIGPNGAGKTTLINMLTGSTLRDSGTVEMDGRRLDGRATYTLARSGIARTFQIPRPLGDLTVRESVLVAAVASRRAVDVNEATDRTLDVVGLAAEKDRTWTSLNGSQQRRVEVARALAQAPRVLLLDEPMSGLSAEEIDALTAVIRDVRDTHPDMTILFVEHLMRVMMTLADHITVLDRGQVIASGTPREVASDSAVVDAYLGSSIA